MRLLLTLQRLDPVQWKHVERRFCGSAWLLRVLEVWGPGSGIQVEQGFRAACGCGLRTSPEFWLCAFLNLS